MFSPSSLFFLADLDCFFVEVERLHRPELRGRPVIIGGRPEARGVVSACSYEARRFGVRSAMTMGEAYRLAPQAVFLHEGLHGSYGLYSRRVQDILRASVPLFKAKSFDEFELDLSGCERWLAREHGGPEAFAEHLRRRVRAEIGLKLSVGIAASPLVAKLASRGAKPDGVFRVLPEQQDEWLAPLPVEAVPGIGEVTAARLHERGILRVGQLVALPRALLRQHFDLGVLKLVEQLAGRVAPMPGHPLAGEIQRPQLSIGHETTFERDELDPQKLEATLWELTEKSCRRLREKGLRAGSLSVRVRYSDFKTISASAGLEEPLDVESQAWPMVQQLYAQAHSRRLRVRLLGVRFEKLSPGSQQLALFATPQQLREERLFGAVDRLRDKFGRDSLLLGPATPERLRQAG